MAKTIQLAGHTYELVTAPTKANRMYMAWLGSHDYSLDCVYGSYSGAKERAFEYCRDRERELNSYNGVISSHNLMMFTYAFTCTYEGVDYLIYITPSHDFAVPLSIVE